MVELTFNDTAADVATLRARADEKLTPLAQALGKALPGSTELPEPAAALPTEDRIKLGVRVHLKNLMGLEGAKGGAIGYHSKGTERWRSLATAADEAQSKTRFAALAKRPEASPLTPPIGAESIQLKLKRGSSDRPATWLVARCGPRLIGVGDEWLSSTETKSSAMSEASKRKALASRCTP